MTKKNNIKNYQKNQQIKKMFLKINEINLSKIFFLIFLNDKKEKNKIYYFSPQLSFSLCKKLNIFLLMDYAFDSECVLKSNRTSIATI